MTVHINDSSVWRAFEDSELTHSAAHYLMTIMLLRQQNGYARVTDVAEHLKVSRGAASRATTLLKERGWIQEDLHRMLELTEGGLELAKSVQRNYLIVECFLEDILGVPVDVAREDACKMEHLLSPQTTTSLFRFIRLIMKDPELKSRLNQQLIRAELNCEESGTCDICEEYGKCLATEAEQSLQLDRPSFSQAEARILTDELEKADPIAPSAVESRTLADLAPGQKGHVLRVLGSGDIHRRILDMGISKGVTIEVERMAPLKDPIKVKLRGYSLSLRKSEARLIEIDEDQA